MGDIHESCSCQHLREWLRRLHLQDGGSTSSTPLRTVDCPGPGGLGREFQNMPWPRHVPDSAQGKVLLLHEYRYSVQPENVLTRCSGYMSEKVPEALLAGAIPIYWGDPPDESFWNTDRFLMLRTGVNDTRDIEDKVALLESSPEARAAFFKASFLQPSSAAWVESWSARARALAEGTIRAHPYLKRRLPWV